MKLFLKETMEMLLPAELSSKDLDSAESENEKFSGESWLSSSFKR